MKLNRLSAALVNTGAFVADKYREAGIVAGVALAPVLAFAQSTDPFDAAMADAKVKIALYAAGLVGTAAVAVVFMIGLKYVKKIPRAA